MTSFVERVAHHLLDAGATLIEGVCEADGNFFAALAIRNDGESFTITSYESTKKWGVYAAMACWISLAGFVVARPGYHSSNFGLSVPSRVRVRVWSMRCAPGFDHRIC